MRRFIVPLGVLLSLLTLLGAGLQNDAKALPSPLIGKPAPAFSLGRLEDAAQLVTPKQFQGQPWVFNVWASWCGGCRQEHPVLLDLARQDLAPIVGLDYMDQAAEGQKWLAQHGNPYRVTVQDPKGRAGIDYGVVGVPETFVIDAQGVVRLKHSGPLTAEVVKTQIVPLLKALRRG